MIGPHYLLDTDTFVYIRRGAPARARARFDRLERGEAVLSVIAYGELVYGIEKKGVGREPWRVLEELIQMIPVVPLPLEAANVYGSIRAALARKGEIIGSNDLWIAAHAKMMNLILVTTNEREFRRVPGLKLENWVQ